MKSSPYVTQLTCMIGLFALFAGYNFMFADAPAGVTPPAGNVAAPLNVGSTAQSKSAGLDLASLTVQGGSIFKTMPTISNTAPTFEFEDTTADSRDFWFRANDNVMYLLADRNDDDAWTGEDPWPLAVRVGASAADDYVVFSNEVRAATYCDREGENCVDASAGVSCSSVPYIRTVAVTYANGGGLVPCGWDDFSCMANYCASAYGGWAGYHAAALKTGASSLTSFSCYDWDVTSTCNPGAVIKGNQTNAVPY